MTHNTADGVTVERAPSLVAQLLARGELAEAIAASATAATIAVNNGTPTDPSIVEDMYLIAQAIGDTELQEIAGLGSHILEFVVVVEPEHVPVV